MTIERVADRDVNATDERVAAAAPAVETATPSAATNEAADVTASKRLNTPKPPYPKQPLDHSDVSPGQGCESSSHLAGPLSARCVLALRYRCACLA